MSNQYRRIEKLSRENCITVTTLCRELGIARSALSELKAGRTQSLSSNHLQQVADYFNVSTKYLLTGEKTASRADENIEENTFSNRLFAAYGDTPPTLSDDAMDDVADYLRFVAERESKKREKD